MNDKKIVYEILITNGYARMWVNKRMNELRQKGVITSKAVGEIYRQFLTLKWYASYWESDPNDPFDQEAARIIRTVTETGVLPESLATQAWLVAKYNQQVEIGNLPDWQMDLVGKAAAAPAQVQPFSATATFNTMPWLIGAAVAAFALFMVFRR